MITVMASEFLVVDVAKLDPKEKQQLQVGCLYGRRLMRIEKKETRNEKKESKRCNSHGQCCQGL